ncbi:TonB-dependent receptor [Hymenobacter sp. J193]|uniref:SusC/RagA family TonB-linked outer membrane protein n=1 Tax=Hymenobacter sp. J193 TaxID=2898429 RepID=UPI002151C137|nr:TonB-dependent receptor [Hymenobacter sp. J193]MCR5890900.1 TonB-dependent receptor [Hymenobacter sp. J193]MCR5890985.1 TonB-dependent receptor [Hymenobacter sp. J193]
MRQHYPFPHRSPQPRLQWISWPAGAGLGCRALAGKLLLLLVLACTATVGTAYAQTGSVSGRVLDEKQAGIPGATVLVEGTSLGSSTNADGTYTVQNVPAGSHNLVISFVGFNTLKMAITVVAGQNLAVADAALLENANLLNEAVVIGYGTVAKSDVTGSVASLKGSDLNKTPASSVDQLLQGKIAGVQVVVPSGEPGAGATVRIRGASSINGSNSPLLVVDGYPWGEAGNLKQINPDDIESIEVLKDASAAAIYGSRGANGVILVTTRKGKAGKTRINLSTLNTISTLPSKLDVWSDPVDVAVIDNEARQNAGLTPLFTGQDYLGTYYPSVAELRGEDPNKPKWPTRTYWPDEVYRNPFSQSYTLTGSGGNEQTKFSVSGNYYREEGLAIKNYYDRYNGRLNLEQKLLDNVTTGVNLILTHTQRNGGGLSADRSPVFPIYNADGTYFKIGPRDFGNPIAYANEVLNKSKTIDVLGTLFVSWDIASWLNFRTQVSDKYGNSVGDVYEPRDITGTGYLFNGYGVIDNYNGNELLNENYFTFNKNIGTVHNLNIVAGYTTQNFTVRTSRLEGRGFINDALRNESLNTAKTQFATNGQTKSLLNSFIGRVNYSLLDRYLLTFTGRADGSSKFGANNKWAFFPSAALGWKLHEEGFLRDVSAVTEAKLRLSYGLTGNQGISPYQTLDRLGSGRYFTGGEFQTGFGPGTFGYDGYNKIWEGVPNPDLRWETTSQLNAGLDLALFNQRLTLSADYYYKRTSDLLRQTYITPSSGYDRLWINDGEIENKGFELGMSTNILEGPVQWSVGGNFTLNRNKLLSMGEDNFVWNGSSIEMLRAPLNAFIVNEPINVFYGYKTDGIIQTVEEGQAAGLTGDMAKPGEIKYVDLNSDGVVDDKDRTIIGDPNPKFLYSLNTSVSSHGFDLSAQLYGVQGNDVFDFRKFSPSAQLQRWTPDNPTNEYPSVNANRAYYGSDWFVTKGSFLRVQNVTLGYNFKSNFVKGIESLRIYFSGNNLYNFTKYHTGFDPEVPANGQQWGSYPRPRAFSLGVNLGI